MNNVSLPRRSRYAIRKAIFMLRQSRENADYRPRVSVDRHLALEAIILARRVIQLLGKNMADQDKHFIAERVRHYLKNAHPGGATLTVLEDEIWREEFAWHVPVQPDFEPERLFEYYETLTDAMIALTDEENLKVYLVASTAKADLVDQAA